jgi:hypothetical protein
MMFVYGILFGIVSLIIIVIWFILYKIVHIFSDY